MDLDDEELKATRRINGSDKNVACIEKDIKILEEFIEDSKDYIHYSITGDELGALEHLIKAYKELEEYKKIAELNQISCCTAQNCEALNNSIKDALENMKLKEKIKELEEENKVWKNNYYEQKEFNNKQALYITENFIPVSLVEEKIEELKEKGESDLRTYGFAIETHLAKQVLQELLEKRK